jgi:hypothetical protein
MGLAYKKSNYYKWQNIFRLLLILLPVSALSQNDNGLRIIKESRSKFISFEKINITAM